jgi:hypothetical protein
MKLMRTMMKIDEKRSDKNKLFEREEMTVRSGQMMEMAMPIFWNCE